MGFTQKRTLLCVGVLLATLVISLAVASVASAAGTVAWTVRAVAEPTHFFSNDSLTCQSEGKCDRYQVLVTNIGDEASSGPITVIDKLPPGIKPLVVVSGIDPDKVEWGCTESEGPGEQWTVACKFAASVPAGGFAPFIDVLVSAPTSSMSGSLKNEVSVTGGGAVAAAAAIVQTPISSQAPLFGVSEFDFEADGVAGAATVQAAAHPWEITTSFGTAMTFSPPGIGGTLLKPVENMKDVSVELPAGFVGDPQAVPQCTEPELRKQMLTGVPPSEKCPPASRVGAIAYRAGFISEGEFQPTGYWNNCCSAVYNMVPEGGYPAEFGVTFATVPFHLYASVVHTGSGYHLRITTPGVPAELETEGVVITFFGDPEKLNGGTSETAFLTNPADCSAGPLSGRIELESWENPVHPVSRDATAYSQVTGCNLLQFHPSLALAPSAAPEAGTTQADEPSGYTVDLKIPQTASFSELATPALRDATVTLPQGVSVSPSAAQGLVGCQAEGPEGINIGSADIGAGGQDLGDPEATELGAGHAGGNGSPYDDGFYHTARGHCPSASTLGTVEVFTPLLPTGPGGSAPLNGHIYLAAPKCGGQGQPACTEASATNGELFGLYIEAEGSGVIIKLPGSVAANPATGQLTGTFKENPQLPFSDLKFHFHGGPRAPLANPQVCGSFATTSTLTSWGGQEASGASPSFGVDWDGKGGACPASLPFAPGFSAGTTSPAAGAFSPFVLSFSRQDREQDLSGLSVTLPPGLLGKIAGIPLCSEAQANAGTCGPESQLGTASVLAGPGTNPLYVSGGRVYLTTGYKGQPFGLSIVVPAVAGPFNLGDVVVRASIHINPETSQVTVISDPLPQSKDGVPFRLRTVNVEINRSGFTFNPTNCSAQQITATITAAQGASAAVSSPFAVTGCAGLPFKPQFTASTQGKTSKANGASLHVKIASAGIGQASIAKVDLTIPAIMPTRLTTIQKACLAKVFEANPAACPPQSDIATATVRTPLLADPLSGPVYFVSHGGAAFPDTEIILQGDGVELLLDGHTQITKGVTYSRFETVPDAPFTSFEFYAPEGPYSIFGANGNLCQTEVRMPTTLTAQNGAVLTQSTLVEPEGCPNNLTILSHSVKKRTITLKVAVPAAGKLTATGKHLTKASKTAGGRGIVTLTLKATGHGKVNTKVKLTFVPPKGKHLTATLSARFKR